MKKMIAAVLVLFCIISTKAEIFGVSGDEFIVSMLSFEESADTVTVFAEALTATGKSEGEMKRVLLKASGKTVKKAIKKLHKTAPKKLMLSHVSAIIVSKDISPELLSEVYKFCITQRDISVGAVIVCAKSPLKLYSEKPSGALCTGFLISELLDRITSKENPEYITKVYEMNFDKDKVVLPLLEKGKNGIFVKSATSIKTENKDGTE